MLPPGLFHHTFPAAPSQGFSLVELLLVLGLLALLAGLSLPNLHGWMERNRIGRLCEQLASDLHHASLQAQQQQQPLRLTRRTGCPWGTATPTDWSCGWQLMRPGTGEVLRHAAVHTPVQVLAAKPGALSVSAQGALGQVGDRWTVRSRQQSVASACSVCLNGAGRIRTVPGHSCQ